MAGPLHAHLIGLLTQSQISAMKRVQDRLCPSALSGQDNNTEIQSERNDPKQGDLFGFCSDLSASGKGGAGT